MSTQMKYCPDCTQLIYQASTSCPHCGNEKPTSKSSLSTILLLGFALTACQKKGEPETAADQTPDQEETENVDVAPETKDDATTPVETENPPSEEKPEEGKEGEGEEEEAEEKPPAFDPDMTVKPLYGVDVVEPPPSPDE